MRGITFGVLFGLGLWALAALLLFAGCSPAPTCAAGQVVTMRDDAPHGWRCEDPPLYVTVADAAGARVVPARRLSIASDVVTPDPGSVPAARPAVVGPAALAVDEDDLTGPLKITVVDPVRCAAAGHPTPCLLTCGRLSYKKARKQWTIRGCDALAALFPTPAPTPRPSATARPTAVPTARPTPTEKVCAAPCCVHWSTGKCTCPCPE